MALQLQPVHDLFNRLLAYPVPRPYAYPLAFLGGLWATRKLYQLASFTWLHFLRPSGFDRYKRTISGAAPWAVVTGASDGIGRGFAEELASRGLNVVLHGRNESKLQTVKTDLQNRYPAREFRLLIIDAMADIKDETKMRLAIEAIQDLEIKVLVNNIGGNASQGPLMSTLQDHSAALVDTWIDVSSRFPTQITRLLLPTLLEQQPVLMLNIGSGISEYGAPWFSVYSGAKAYNIAWSRSLAAEFVATGQDVECIAVLVGGVATERSHREASFTEPSPRTMAKSCLDVAGSGYKVLWAYVGHHLIFGVLGQLPLFAIEKVFQGMAKQIKTAEEKGEKAL